MEIFGSMRSVILCHVLKFCFAEKIIYTFAFPNCIKKIVLHTGGTYIQALHFD